MDSIHRIRPVPFQQDLPSFSERTETWDSAPHNPVIPVHPEILSLPPLIEHLYSCRNMKHERVRVGFRVRLEAGDLDVAHKPVRVRDLELPDQAIIVIYPHRGPGKGDGGVAWHEDDRVRRMALYRGDAGGGHRVALPGR